MSDKNYDIQVSVNTKTNLAGFEQTQQALDSIRNKARAVSDSSTSAPAKDVKELTEGIQEAAKAGTD